MSVTKKNPGFSLTVLAVLFALPVLFSACGSPIGFGKPIDWEPPVLTMDPGRNPMYVGLGAKLSGTVTDNTGVERIILREAGSGKELFQATLLPPNRWEIALNFDASRNGEKLAVEVVAFDRAGNSGGTSIKAITLIVDVRPPIIEDIEIIRTDSRRTYPRSWIYLRELEQMTDDNGNPIPGKDAKGENSEYVEEYQNGYFHIAGQVSEEETRIEIISLNIYDINNPVRNAEGEDEPLLKLPFDTGNKYSPRWPISEEELITTGVDKFGAGYETDYYDAGKRYYYLLEIEAIDRGQNPSEDKTNIIKQEQGYFCMWEKADEPKGIIDPGVGTVVQGGATIPVEFFDDDTLVYAATGMFTKDQWEGKKPIASGVYIMGGGSAANPPLTEDVTSAANKLAWLKTRIIVSKAAVYDWHFDIYSGSPTATKVPITELINGKKDVSNSFVYIETGKEPNDYGDFVLFSIVGDEKLSPHTNTNPGPNWTDRPREMLRHWEIAVVDENQPLIVFDTVDTEDTGYVPSQHPGYDTLPNAATGNSPEENTFPKLTDGRYFEINGYTLRATKEGTGVVENYVKKFRIAWIPYGMPDGADKKINAVQEALKANNYPDSFNGSALAGVQHWNYVPIVPVANPNGGGQPVPGGSPGDPTLVTGSKQTITGGNKFQKQVFKKRFDILGGSLNGTTAGKVSSLADYETGGTIPLYNEVGNITNESHFVYNNKLENETKLFVIYAEDNMGNYVFRQVRFLANKKPPKLEVYDITKEDADLPAPPAPQLPDLNNDTYFSGGVLTPAKRLQYQNDLAAYQPTAYPSLRTFAIDSNGFKLPDSYKSQPYTAYPRDLKLKYWVRAERTTNEVGGAAGDLAIADIKMQDITNDEPPTGYPNTGHYEAADRSLSYIEMLPEVTQRVFLFTATDSLGNKATMQRTIAVTNAAVLNNITTTSQTGKYGIGETITLQANFSNLVRWTGTRPQLNVRYKDSDGVVKIKQLDVTRPASGVAAQALEFDFMVEENFGGILETMWLGIGNGLNDPGTANNASPYNDRPLYLPSFASTGNINIIDDTRNAPAFIPGYSYGFTWTDGSSSLQRNGKRIELDGKRPVITGLSVTGKPAFSGNDYYFKADETIQFTLTTGTSPTSEDIFTGSTLPRIRFTIGGAGPYYATWQKSQDARTMVFTYTVPQGQNGLVGNYMIENASTIVDSCGNGLAGTATTNSTGNFPIPASAAANVTIDTTPPAAPPTSLNGTVITTAVNQDFGTSPVLTITRAAAGIDPQQAKTEYSLDGGVSWVEFATAKAGWTTVNVANTSLNISNGQWTLQTRFTDAAGNIGAVTTKAIHVNTKFPDLKTIIAAQAAGTYGTGSTLQFNLSFDAVVWTQNAANVTITLTNRKTGNTHKAGGTTEGTNPNTHPSYQRQLSATAVAQANPNTTISFVWTNIGGAVNDNAGGIKEMIDGLYISAVDFSGLRDRFGNSGGTGTAATVGGNLSITIPGYPNNTCTNLNGAGIKVDCLGPVRTGATPVNAADRTGNVTTSVSSDNKTITLTFDEPVQRGRGTITVRPHGSYAIPPVFENDGYYLTVTSTGVETRSSTAGANSTYVSGMYDIYNNMPSNPATDRNYLITSGTLAAPAESAQTGLSVGPYKKMTHGLTAGAGYTGNYSATNPTAPAAPPAAGDFMIPDTTTKWVLDYQYLIHDTTGAVANIRNALTRVGFRRQDIAVTSTANVAINNNTVTITLSEPLLPGLQWGLFYPEGTFADGAGNSAPALGPDLSANVLADSTYWFWSSGVQRPVIRVDRKSYDARSGNPNLNGGAPTYNANGNAGTIASFNTIEYRIETETPRAGIFYGTREGSGWTTGGSGRVTGAWTGDVGGTNWAGGGANTTGTWVQTNLIFRSGNGNYTVQENGISISHAIQNYYGFRSFNRDITETELTGLTMATGNATQAFTSSFTYADLEASKSYVAAEARVDHTNVTTATAYGGTATYTSQKGYEGVFRTVIAIIRTSDSNYIAMMGTNVKNGIPTVAGFPAKDGAHDTDQRYMKLFYNSAARRHYWVSTEIVTNWYMQSVRNQGGNYQETGDTVNWLTAGYGDLSYAYHNNNGYSNN